MTMQKRDWYDYVDYLREEVKYSNLQEPETIGEAYNNYQVMQDLNDVLENKLMVQKQKPNVKTEAQGV